MIFGTTAVIVVGAFAVAAAMTHDDGSGSPEHAVRDFLVSAVAEHNGFQACLYLTRGSQLAVEAGAPRDMSCEATLSTYARLVLGGEHVNSEAAVKALTYRVEPEPGGRERVTVSAHGVSRSFLLRQGTQAELGEFQAPSTQWRIASGVGGLLAR